MNTLVCLTSTVEPYLSSSSATSTWPCWLARWSAIYPSCIHLTAIEYTNYSARLCTFVGIRTSAPPSRSSLVTSVYPFSLATWSGVKPFYEHYCMHIKLQRVGQISPYCTLLFPSTSAPFLTSKLTTSFLLPNVAVYRGVQPFCGIIIIQVKN